MQKQKAMLLVMMDVDPEHEEEFNRWYNEEHTPELVALPGFINGRRFKSAQEGEGKYLALYEIESPDVLKNPPYTTLPVTEWRNKMRKFLKRRARNVYVEIMSMDHKS